MSAPVTLTKYSIAAAHRITGKSRTTIAKHVAAGKLSCVEDASGAKLIDASELIRVYGDACDFSREEGASQPAAAGSGGTGQGEQVPVTSLAAQLEKEIAERERERAHFRQQIDHLQDALKLAQEGQNKAMLLLEHRGSGGGEWREALAALEERLKTEQETAKAQAKREALAELKNQPWWKLLSA